MAVTSKCLLCLHAVSLTNFFNGQFFSIWCFFFFFSNTGLHSDPLLHKVELAIRLSIPEGSEGVPV